MPPIHQRLRQNAIAYRRLARTCEQHAEVFFGVVDCAREIALSGRLSPENRHLCESSAGNAEQSLARAAWLHGYADYLEHLAPPFELIETATPSQPAPSPDRDVLALKATDDPCRMPWPPAPAEHVS